MAQIRKFFSLARPIQLLFALLTYGLGLGLARYLGASLLAEPQFFGGVIVIFLLSVSNLLAEYFRPSNEPISPDETRKEREELGSQLLIVSISLMVTSAILAYLLIRQGFIGVNAAIILVVFLLLALAYAVPPFRFVNRGLGEISSSIMIASLSPGIAFLLQYGSLHRLLQIFTLPLVLLALAYFLALNFPAFTSDLKYDRKSLLVNLTWQRAVPLHNFLLVGGYLFFAITPFLGVPIGLVWPALLTLPIAAYQIFSLRNLADGAKPVWSLFVATATAVFGLTSYLVALTFWLH